MSGHVIPVSSPHHIAMVKKKKKKKNEKKRERKFYYLQTLSEREWNYPCGFPLNQKDKVMSEV